MQALHIHIFCNGNYFTAEKLQTPTVIDNNNLIDRPQGKQETKWEKRRAIKRGGGP